MDIFHPRISVFAILIPGNKAAADSFSLLAQKKLADKDWNPTARQNMEVNDQPFPVSSYSNASESDGGTSPPVTFRPILRGYYIFDFDLPPRQPDKGWLIGGGKFSGGDESPGILLTERKHYNAVSSRHARLAHNFSSGALVITASDNNVVLVNGHEVVDDQRVIHGQVTSLEFGQLKYALHVRSYIPDTAFRSQLNLYKFYHAIADDDYPSNLLATPANSDIVTQDYVMKNPVGDGATSVVYAAIDKRNGLAVAIKKIRRTRRNAKAIDRDINIANYIGKHRRICNLIDVIDPANIDPGRGYKEFGFDEVYQVYMPLAPWTVLKLIELRMDLDDKTREEIFWQLLEGIAYLHSMGVMHRDIKPNNMTVVSVNPAHPEARLIDFGLATIGLQSRDYQAGTQQYHAPEMLAGWDNRTNDPYDERVDMFAFGLSMYQFFCGQLCGWQRIDMDSSKKISTSNLTEIENRLFASRNRKELMELISFLISWDPQRRPSAREAMSLGGREQPARSVDEEERARVDRDRDDTQDGGIGSSMGRMSISGAGPISHDRSSRQESRLPHDGSSREENHPGGSRMFASKPPTEYCPLEIPEGGMTQDLNELTHHHLDID